jgi:hypothetical protein
MEITFAALQKKPNTHLLDFYVLLKNVAKNLED